MDSEQHSLSAIVTWFKMVFKVKQGHSRSESERYSGVAKSTGLRAFNKYLITSKM